MRYRNYGIRDFVRDPFFQRWVLAPTTEADAFWRAWIAENPDKQFVVEEAKRIILLLGFVTDADVNARLLQTWKALNVDGFQAKAAATTGDSHAHTLMWRVAAVFALFVVAGVALWYFQYRTVTITTRFSEIKSVRLPDGTVVDLNGNSSIEYMKDWTEGAEREVWLEGEAFFFVTHDRNRKFVVYTSEGVEVNVLGTTFNVISRRNTTRVSLNTGEIKINLGEKFSHHNKKGQDGGFVMSPGEAAEFDANTNKIVRHAAPVKQYASWKDKKIIFDNTAMHEVAAMLQDTHGLKVFLDESLKMRKITGEFRSDDLDILIQFIARALHAHVRINAGEIHFTSIESKQ
jgi:transmembrane sensor